jgi:hypothetical protein
MTLRPAVSCATIRSAGILALACLLPAIASCRAASAPQHRTFATPEQAVQALTEAAKAGKVEELSAIFGPDAKELIDSSDPVVARRNRQVFVAAAAERWRLVDRGANGKTLVVGNEEWAFPIPLVNADGGWRFDTASGKEEIVARRIGRNELAVISVCRTYVAAQHLYALNPHDGKPAGLYAATFRSDPGRQNGLYWPAARQQRRSPLGDLLAEAADVRPTGDSRPAPFHGYFFRILTAQGPAAAGGARGYIVGGEMSGGHALVAWPSQYDATGVMTFLVGHDGVVREKDLGVDTDSIARAMSTFDPDASWGTIQ